MIHGRLMFETILLGCIVSSLLLTWSSLIWLGFGCWFNLLTQIKFDMWIGSKVMSRL